MKWRDMKTDTKHAMEMIGGRLYKESPHITLIQEIIGNANDEFEKQKDTNPIVKIDFIEDSEEYYIIFNNNAPPIPKEFFKEDYHELFKSSKSSKEGGIGFVGVGAKQFLQSKDGREIITITGSDKDEILASVWKWSDVHGARIATTPETSLDEIIGKRKICHTNGTTFIAKLTLEEYRELKENITRYLQFWWNYALLVNRFKIFVSGKEVKPWIPNENEKHSRDFQMAGKKIECMFWITETELDERLQNIIFIVADKRINNKKLETSGRIIGDYGKRIFCYADVSKLLKPFVLMSKEDFETGNPFVSKIRQRVVEEFWKFVVEKNLLKTTQNETTTNAELEMLMQKFNEAVQSEKFKKWNPFLAQRTREIPVANENGTEQISESEGQQKTGKNAIKKGNGGTFGNLTGTGMVFDKNGNEKGDRKIRQARGFNMGEIDDPNDEREAWIDYPSKSLLINIGHPFFKKHSAQLLVREFNKCRVIIDVLIRHQLEASTNDVKTILDEARDLFHEVYS